MAKKLRDFIRYSREGFARIAPLRSKGDTRKGDRKKHPESQEKGVFRVFSGRFLGVFSPSPLRVSSLDPSNSRTNGSIFMRPQGTTLPLYGRIAVLARLF